MSSEISLMKHALGEMTKYLEGFEKKVKDSSGLNNDAPPLKSDNPFDGELSEQSSITNEGSVGGGSVLLKSGSSTSSNLSGRESVESPSVQPGETNAKNKGGEEQV